MLCDDALLEFANTVEVEKQRTLPWISDTVTAITIGLCCCFRRVRSFQRRTKTFRRSKPVVIHLSFACQNSMIMLSDDRSVSKFHEIDPQ